MIKSQDRARVYFKVVLGEDIDVRSWDSKTFQDYSAAVRLYNRLSNGRTFEQFLRDVVGEADG